MPRCLPLSLMALVLCTGAPAPGRTASKPAAVAATIDTTLTTDAGHIRQFAFDGNPSTYFASASNPSRKDHFTLVFDQPVALASVLVTTGRPEGRDQLQQGMLEGSADGKRFEPLAKFADGVARGKALGGKLRAVRIQPTADLKHPLVLREIVLASEPVVTVFKYPVEFVVNVTDAPEMKAWAEKTARVCERQYPMINEQLPSAGYQPPRQVTLTLKKSYRGVAAAGGNRIVGSVRYFQSHPDDVGAMVHETVHIVQGYGYRGNPSWLVEGIADYIRFFKYEPGKLGPIDPDRARYNSSYRVSAAFLAYLTQKYDSQIVRKLNARMRAGKYQEAAFKELTGKTVQELGKEWRASLRPRP